MDLGNGFLNAANGQRIKKTNDLMEQQNLLIWNSMSKEQQDNYLRAVEEQNLIKSQQFPTGLFMFVIILLFVIIKGLSGC